MNTETRTIVESIFYEDALFNKLCDVYLAHPMPDILPYNCKVIDDLLNISEQSLSIIPSGVSVDKHNEMTDLLRVIKDDPTLELNDLSRIFSLCSRQVLRIKHNAEKYYFSFFYLLICSKFDLTVIPVPASNYDYFKESTLHNANASPLFLELLSNAKSIPQLIHHLYQIPEFKECYRSLIHKFRVGDEGILLHNILDIMCSYNVDTQSLKALARSKYRFVKEKKINHLVDLAEQIAGTLVFGVNYITAPLGVILNEKIQSR